jgi:hypothetical protein
MNDILELWSLPWHALQRSLAKGFGAATTGNAPANLCSSGTGVASAQNGSWLARARRVAPPAAVPQAYR